MFLYAILKCYFINSYVFKITSGQRDKKSLTFLAKIGSEFFEYRLKTINRKTGSFAPDLVEVIPGKKTC